jgi:hypothetical protein
LKLTSQCAHWIEVTGNSETDKADFYKYLSDSMTPRSAEETILTQPSSLMALDAEMLDAGRFLSHLPQSLSE